MNGLNQGRINMAFWTQLLSEWACIPTALSLCTLGGSVAAAGEEWTSIALPILVIFAFVVQVAGASFGVAALGTSVDELSCWTAREKWICMHFFSNIGFTATKKGYEQDVFQLAKDPKGNADNSLFSKVYPKQEEYVKQRNAAETQREKMEEVSRFQKEITEVRLEHFEIIEKNIETLENEGLIVRTKEDGTHESHSLWKNAEHNKCIRAVQIIFILVLLGTFWGTWYAFFYQLDLKAAVQDGFDHLIQKEMYFWVAAAVFPAVYILYYICEIGNSCGQLCGCCCFVFKGCALAGGVESEYATPKWQPSDVLEESGEARTTRDISLRL